MQSYLVNSNTLPAGSFINSIIIHLKEATQLAAQLLQNDIFKNSFTQGTSYGKSVNFMGIKIQNGSISNQIIAYLALPYSL